MLKLFSLFQSRHPRARRPRPLAPASNANSPERTEADWARLRSPLRSRDLALTEAASDWMAQLPAGLRPARLCARFPGVANRLALCWSDGSLVERVFESLLLDQRGHRLGFPPPVANELMRLRTFRARHAAPEDQGARPWDTRHQATNDR